jgi:hypothetical protein
MSGSNEKFWAGVIHEVQGVIGLSALAILALVPISTIALFNSAAASDRAEILVGLLMFLMFLILGNMFYLYRVERDITFRIRVARSVNGQQEPCEGALLRVFKNNHKFCEEASDENGDVTFRVPVKRTDDLHVIVFDSGTQQQRSNKAAIYSQGECRIVKTITVA